MLDSKIDASKNKNTKILLFQDEVKPPSTNFHGGSWTYVGNNESLKVVSNYQAEASHNSDGGCGRNPLRNCRFPVSTLPLYAFKKERQENPKEDENTDPSNEEHPQTCFLHNLLLSQWDDRMSKGPFRYDVTCFETKIIPGEFGFIAQLNEGRRLKKRPTEFRNNKVLQPFDESKFNFTKVRQEEALLLFGENSYGTSQLFPGAPTSEKKVSPIEYGHLLLIPRVLDRFPQRIDHESFFLAMKFSKEAADPFFRIGYSSLGAFATTDHLHFQVEKPPTRRITTNPGWRNRRISVPCLSDYPVRGVVFEEGNSVKDLSGAVASSRFWLQSNNIPFNVLISDSGRSVPVSPEKQALGQVSQDLVDTQVNPAVWEISGHIVLKKRKDYDNLSEKLAWRLLAEVSLSEDKFEDIKVCVVRLQEEQSNSSNQKDDHSVCR